MTNLEIVRSTYEGANAAANGRVLQQYLAPEARWTEAAGFPYAGTYVGFEAIRTHVFARLGAEWDNYHTEIEGYAEGPGLVIAYGTYKGTYLATGKYMEARVAHVWKLHEGRIVSFEQFVDSQTVGAALR